MIGRRFLYAVAAALSGLLAAGSPAGAQDNPLPQGRMTLVVGFAAGGPLDIVCRLVADKLGPRIDRTIVLEHRAGAGGNLAAAAVAKADANGLTVLAALDTAFTVNPYIFKAPGFRNEELAPLAQKAGRELSSRLGFDVGKQAQA